MSHSGPSTAGPDADSGQDKYNGRPRAPSKSSSARRSIKSGRSAGTDESTPLLSRSEDTGYGSEPQATAQPSQQEGLSILSNDEEPSKRGFFRRRWPTVVALSALCIVMIVIMAVGFAAPAFVEEYAQQAAVFEPTNLSIDSFTAKGVNARVQGNFILDGSRVEKKAVRDLGRAATWIARAIEVHPQNVRVELPEYDDARLGSADVPPMVLSIRNGDVNHLDFIAGLKAGDLDGIRKIANDWMQGNMAHLKVIGKSDVAVKSGIFSLGTQSIAHGLVFEGSSIPAVPQYDIKKLQVHEANNSMPQRSIHADVEIAVFNEYPVSFTVAPLRFDILVPGCTSETNNIMVATAATEEIEIVPKGTVAVVARAVVRQLPDTLVSVCPGSGSSPLDALLSSYMHGEDTTVLVQGSSSPMKDTPQWLSELLANTLVPISITGHSFSNLIEDFSMKDVHFSMPDSFADPDTPQAQPKISAIVKVQARLPQEINFSIDVPRVRADSDVFFKGQKLGHLDLHEWQKANSTRVEAHGKAPPKMIIESVIKDAPLNVTDTEVLSEVIEEIFLGQGKVVLEVQASVDANISTVLGSFVVRGIPAKGKVPLNQLSGRKVEDLDLKIGQLELLQTTKASVSLSAAVNLTNPTNYSAFLPFADVNISWNRTLMGHATVEGVYLKPGRNLNIPLHAVWSPGQSGGEAGLQASRELISRYVSGYNTTLTLNTHAGSIPSLPELGQTLSKFGVTIKTPRLSAPKHPDDEPDGDRKPHFLEDATMHLFSSTATFTLLSPLAHTILYLTYINATAFYNHTEPVGKIMYDLPFAIPPGASASPRLPVDWSLGGVGYGAVRDALGGSLKLDATADVGIKVGQWEEDIWFKGKGIGASVEI